MKKLSTFAKKYLICIPLMILSVAGIVLAQMKIINHDVIKYILCGVCIVVFGVCMVVIRSEMHIWAPREGVKYYADVNPSVVEDNPNEK